jgi:putative flippase GtrA
MSGPAVPPEPAQPSAQPAGQRLRGLAAKVMRFALTGAIATGINIGLYLLLVNRVLPPVAANLVAYSSSVVVNFMLQKRYVFQLERSAGRAFTLSMLASVGGLLLDTGIVAALNVQPFFAARQWLIKCCSTGVVFIYNFISKRYIFEKRLS